MGRWKQRTDWAEWQTDMLLSQPFIAERVYRRPKTLDKTEKDVVDLVVVHGDSSILISQKAPEDPERRSPEKNALWVRKRAKECFSQLSGALSRPDLRLGVSDHLLGIQMFGHLRQTDTMMPVP
jgi:hypothetical protein